MSNWLEKVSLGGGKAEEAKDAKVERNKRNKSALEEAMKYTGVQKKPVGYDTEVNTDKKYNSGIGFGGPDAPKKKPKND